MREGAFALLLGCCCDVAAPMHALCVCGAALSSGVMAVCRVMAVLTCVIALLFFRSFVNCRVWLWLCGASRGVAAFSM